jgi:hypothetical protein
MVTERQTGQECWVVSSGDGDTGDRDPGDCDLGDWIS